MRRFVLLVALAWAVAGCSSPGPSSPQFWHDDARGVGCWLTYQGISCLPDSQYHP